VNFLLHFDTPRQIESLDVSGCYKPAVTSIITEHVFQCQGIRIQQLRLQLIKAKRVDTTFRLLFTQAVKKRSCARPFTDLESRLYVTMSGLLLFQLHEYVDVTFKVLANRREVGSSQIATLY